MFDIPYEGLWIVPFILTLIVLIGNRLAVSDGVDGASDVRDVLSNDDWAMYLTEEELVVLAVLIARADMRSYWGKDISNID
ncbi:MAG: hypothetical protein JSW41_04885 [Candidatus Aenigmatarchaeota archaeon]|nr:MAG: hypothetical protein JSW41_04885 [Candidatus Aenigmarchaeota archaeon]